MSRRAHRTSGPKASEPIERPESQAWLAAFHEGTPAALADCYRRHCRDVERTAAEMVQGADLETVVHEVFYKLLTRQEARQSFQGGNMGRWLARIARNQAIDYLRRYRRERATAPQVLADRSQACAPSPGAQVEARQLVERFRAELLPRRWTALFDARFVRQLSQSEAAEELGMRRTTLIYQEMRIRRLFRRFAMQGEER